MTLGFFLIFAYLMGSIPSGVWIGKVFKNIDIREHGSKNTGTTNSYRVLGPKYGIIVLILDILKGYIPLYMASRYGISGQNLVLLGIVSILGHSLSIFLGFKGGKGVATTLGVFLFLDPKAILMVVILFIIIVFITRYVSLGSIICSLMLPIIITYDQMKQENPNMALILMSVVMGIFVIYRHKSNIKRLMDKKENKFKF